MKSILLIIAVTLVSSFGYSQVTINNDTGETISVGVQVTDQTSGPCSIVESYTATVPDGGFTTFPLVGSQFIFRVGATGDSGTGYVYYTPTCGTDIPGPYTFTFDDWNEVTIE